MMRMLYRILLLSWCMLLASVAAYPIESKPLNNNPESWNLSWLVFSPRNSSDPSAEALVSSDPHVKKSKITPKSIFIAPSNYNTQDKICPHGYRIDDNGKCIKTVTVNQEDLLTRLSDLFGVDTSASNKNTNIDSDYYDFDEDKNDGENSGPLQFNLPLTIDVEEEGEDGKKVEYVVEEDITLRSLNPKHVLPAASEDVTTIVPAPFTERLVADERTTTEMPNDNDEQTTLTEEPVTVTTVVVDTTTLPETTEATTQATTTTTTTTTARSTTTTTTTEKPPIIILPSIEPYKINSVEFMPKITRKSNRNRNKNGEKRIRRPRPQPAASQEGLTLKSQQQQLIEPLPIPKKNRTRVNAKRRKLVTESPATTTTTTTTTESPAAHKPYFWLPKGWTIDETTKEKPVLIRFWAEQPQPHDERARSHNSRHQRVNSKMPTEGIFREVTVPELERLIGDN